MPDLLRRVVRRSIDRATAKNEEGIMDLHRMPAGNASEERWLRHFASSA